MGNTSNPSRSYKAITGFCRQLNKVNLKSLILSKGDWPVIVELCVVIKLKVIPILQYDYNAKTEGYATSFAWKVLQVGAVD